MANHPGSHKNKGDLTRRLRIIHRSTKKTVPSKTKKGVRVKQKKFSPFAALKILQGAGKPE